MLEKGSGYKERFHDGVAEDLSVSGVSIGLSPFKGGTKFEEVGRDLATTNQICHLLAIYLFLEGVDAICGPGNHVGVDLDKCRG